MYHRHCYDTRDTEARPGNPEIVEPLQKSTGKPKGLPVDVKLRVQSDAQVVLGSGADRRTSTKTFEKTHFQYSIFHSITMKEMMSNVNIAFLEAKKTRDMLMEQCGNNSGLGDDHEPWQVN